MYAGVSKLDITPPVGIDMTGYIAREGSSIGVLDPLFARALVVDDGRQKAAILTADLLGLHLDFVNQARAAIQDRAGIPSDNVLITCSHTHAGAATLRLQDCGEIDDAYMARVQRALVDVTQQAVANLRPAQIVVGHGTVTANVHNRRTPGDVIDPDLALLRIADETGKPFALLLNYACHPTCLQAENRYFSAEYPGIAVRKIEAESGVLALFVTGAIGDVGPISRGIETMHAIGESIGAEALRVLQAMEAHDTSRQLHKGADGQDGPLVVKKEAIALPLLPLPSLEWWEAEVAKWQEIQVAPDVPLLPSHPRIPMAMRNWSSRMRDLTAQGALSPQVVSEVQMIRFGEVIFVSAPGELFVELGLAIKAALQPNHVFLCGFGNDDIGYIPTRHAYPKGGYEIAEAYKYYGYPVALAPEAGEMVVTTATRLLA